MKSLTRSLPETVIRLWGDRAGVSKCKNILTMAACAAIVVSEGHEISLECFVPFYCFTGCCSCICPRSVGVHRRTPMVTTIADVFSSTEGSPGSNPKFCFHFVCCPRMYLYKQYSFCHSIYGKLHCFDSLHVVHTHIHSEFGGGHR